MRKCNRTTCDFRGMAQPLINFTKDKRQKDGLNPTCKSCVQTYNDSQKEQKKNYNRQYNLDHQEQIRQQKKQRYQDNKKEALEYNREHRAQRNVNSKKWVAKHPETVKKLNSNFRERNRIRTRQKGRARSQTPQGKFEAYKASAKSKQRIFELTFEQHFNPNALTTFWQKPCTYCRCSIDTIGLDRIDNSKGYTLDNVVPCCKVCNLTRGNRFTYQEMVNIVGPAIIKVDLLRSLTVKEA